MAINTTKRLKSQVFSWLMLMLLVSCSSQKDVVYLQDVPLKEQQVIQKRYELKIQPNDLLSIIISSKEPELVAPFNLPAVTYKLGEEASSDKGVMGYLVDADGDIELPVLGKFPVAGMSRTQLKEYIKKRLIMQELLKDPIVTVQFMNFKISVMGEVNKPNTFNISGDRVTLLDALSMAGDLTVYGRRDRVAVIREKNFQRTIMYHDIRSSDIFDSPCYYLQQNDIVYVEPNKTKTAQSKINSNNSVGVWLSLVSIVASAVTLIITAIK